LQSVVRWCKNLWYGCKFIQNHCGAAMRRCHFSKKPFMIFCDNWASLVFPTNPATGAPCDSVPTVCAQLLWLPLFCNKSSWETMKNLMLPRRIHVYLLNQLIQNQRE
jgi:hypothetical protein